MTQENDEALARREHENMIEVFAIAAANVHTGLVQRSGGVVLVATGLPIRLFNQVLVEADSATPAAVAEAVATTRARRDLFVVSLRAGTDDRFVPLMSELGLVALPDTERTPGMALAPITDTPPAPLSRHEIVRAADEAGIDDHIRAAVTGFGIPESILRSVMRPSMLNSPGVAVYVGYTNGEAVSTGMGVRTGSTIGVYNISTIPDARGRGYGAAMTTRIAADGARNGCDVAILQASDMGFPVYQRLGYRTVVEYVGYVDPAPPTVA